MRRMMIAWMVVIAMAARAPAQTATWMNLTGTQASAFKIGPPASALTMTNSSGVLSLSGGLTANGVVTLGTSVGAFTTTGVITSSVSTGTAPLVIASTSKVTNLNADQVDGISLLGGTTGGTVWYDGTSIRATGAGTAGQFVASDGSSEPDFVGLASGKIFVGNGSNIPAAVTPSGDVTINSSGVTAIGSGKVNSTMIVDDTITAADINDSLGIYIPVPSSSAGGESANTIIVTIIGKSPDGATSLFSGGAVLVNIADTTGNMATSTASSITTAITVGHVFDTVTANKKYILTYPEGGEIHVEVTFAGAGTLYVNYTFGGRTYAQAITFS